MHTYCVCNDCTTERKKENELAMLLEENKRLNRVIAAQSQALLDKGTFIYAILRAREVYDASPSMNS